jgi:hypothetical protein
VFLRYSFSHIGQEFYMVMHALESICQSFVFFLLVYHLAKKGMGLGENKRHFVTKFLRISMYVCSFIFLAELIYQIVLFNTGDVRGLCHSPVFVVPNAVNLMISLCFVWVILTIKKELYN